jgi:uncharacterized protein YndB with AHSA1/START domain
MDSTTNRELLITREFQASPELVWEAWTDPRHIIHWWGPKGSTYTIHEMNVKPGGLWRYIMHVKGYDFTNRIVFKEVIKPRLLSYEHGSDLPDDPRKFQVTVTFEAMGNATKITIRFVFNTQQQRDEVVEKYGALEVNRQSMQKLEEYLSKLH